ncbi:ubiquitin-conjugating enzyme/RWD-like protein [Tanacetum coccineum]
MNKCGEEQLFRTYTTATLEKTCVPGTSNLLQYLLSIQGLILTTMPLFNGLPVLGDSLITFLTIQREYPDKITQNNGVYHGETTQEDVASCIKFLAKAFNKNGSKEVESCSSTACECTSTNPVIAGVGINDAVKQKRKVVKEDLRVSVLKKRKGNDRTFYPFTNKALSDSTLGKVLVEEGDEVERGQYSGSKETSYVLVDHDHSHQMEGLDNEEDVLKRCQNFNKFDTVVDHSDHFFSAESCAMNQQRIFLRVYENRMDLLRAVIIEPTGTPYHNGLFFSDVCFPSNYPDSPPLSQIERWPGDNVGSWQLNYSATSGLHSGLYFEQGSFIQ